MTSPTDFTRKVQGTVLSLTRGMDSPITVGEIQNFDGLSTPVNDINIGDWADTVIVTRPGRKKTSEAKFDIIFNPDATVQQALKEMEGTDEEGIWALTQPEGTTDTRTFTAMVAQFGEDAQDDGIYMGHITLAVLTDAERS